MTVTLFNLTYEVARALGALRSGTATGGTTATIVDTVYRTEDEAYFNKGTAWIVNTTDGAAPEGEMSSITGFNATTDTITVAPVFSVTVGAGDIYAVAKDRYNLPLLRDVVNQALRALGSIPQVNSSLVTLVGVTEYDLPAAAGFDLREVWIETDPDTALDSRPVPVLNAKVDLANAAGGTGKLILPFEYASGLTLKLVYTALHPELWAATDILFDVIHPDLVVYKAAQEALQYYRDKIRSDEFERRWLQLNNAAEQAKVTHQIPLPPPRMREIAMPWAGAVNRDFNFRIR